MILGPPNFYDDGIRPAQLRYPQVKPNLLKAPPPAPQPIVVSSSGPLTINTIIRAVCIVKNVQDCDFRSAGRCRKYVAARQLFYYMARKHTRHSYDEIGRRSGGKDHSTVMHGYRKIKASIDKYADDIAAIKHLLGAK